MTAARAVVSRAPAGRPADQSMITVQTQGETLSQNVWVVAMTHARPAQQLTDPEQPWP